MTPTPDEPTTWQLARELLDVIASFVFSIINVACVIAWAAHGFNDDRLVALGLGTLAVSLLYDIRIEQRKVARS